MPEVKLRLLIEPALEIRRIRRKLGLAQAQASALTGGGPNAFSRYELGKAKPLPAVTNLLLLLPRSDDLTGKSPLAAHLVAGGSDGPQCIPRPAVSPTEPP